MEEQINRLVETTWKKFQEVDDGSRRFLIGIAGIPGSGKTTAAISIAAGLNRLHHEAYHQRFPNSPEVDKIHRDPSQPDVAFVVPLDGYHLTRKQLSEMPDAEEAIFRRGAAFTFDAQSYLKLVKNLKQPLEATTSTVYAPSFDHSVKDPVENDIAIPPAARIVIFEGLYAAMDRPVWREAAGLMDELWFVDVSIEVATARVAKRNFAKGINPTLEASLVRTRESDMRNGKEVLAERLECQQIIRSIEDDEWRSEEMDIGMPSGDGEQEERPTRSWQRMDSVAEMAEAGVGM